MHITYIHLYIYTYIYIHTDVYAPSGSLHLQVSVGNRLEQRLISLNKRKHATSKLVIDTVTS